MAGLGACTGRALAGRLTGVRPEADTCQPSGSAAGPCPAARQVAKLADVKSRTSTPADRGGGDDRRRPAVSASSDRLPQRQFTGVVPFRPTPEETLPNRYDIGSGDPGRFLRCREAPGVGVRLDRGYAFSEAEARKLGERVILLDGAGQFAPLLDDGKHLYNLDHHQGCLRAFTLATCEQALILVLKGLDLDKGDWTLYANQPDLDTVLAIWVLLNYRRVRRLSPTARDAIVPLLRLEGAIDANGFEIAEHCGLPQKLLERERKRLDRLHSIELETKKSGEWQELDLAQYTLEMLLRIDKMVYKSSDFIDYTSVETEYGHVDIGNDRVAVVCRDGSGIYEVEKRLKSLWGDRLGIVALEGDKNHFTLRRSAALAGIALEDAYSRLNLLDPAVDGRPPEKRWGGSDDIGGSPRPSGTGLTPREIVKILKLTYQEVRPWQRLQRLATTVLWTAVLALAAGVGAVAWRLLAPLPAPALERAAELAIFSAVAGIGAGVLIRRLSRGWTWLFGWRRPAAEDWLALVPLVLVGGAVGGVLVPPEIAFDAESLAAAAGAMLLAAVGLGLWFPGLVHGLLILESKVQSVRGRWFVSRPALVAGVLYAGVSVGASRLWNLGSPLPLEAAWQWGAAAGGALVAGVALTMIRERSLSIWPGVGALFAAGVVRVLLGILYAA